MLWNISRIRIRQKNVYWGAVLTACRIRHLSRWRRQRTFLIGRVKGRGGKVGWIVRRISELGGYNNVRDSVKADIFGFDITDVGGNIRLFSEVMKRLEISWMEMSFMRSFRGFMMKVLAEILI